MDMGKKMFLMCALAACTVFELAAMPTEKEAAEAAPSVLELLASEREALASGRKTCSEVAAAALDLAAASDSEAARMLLMKGAFVLYVRDGNLPKAVETMNDLEAAIEDLPPQGITNIIETALLGVPGKSRERFYRLLDESGDEDASAEEDEEESAPAAQEDRDSVRSILNGMIKVPGRDYWLSSTEVTQGQWESVMGFNLSQHKGVNLPVDCVSRDDCDVFIEKLNQAEDVKFARLVFYLPSLCEWKYAALAGTTGSNCWIRAGVVGDVLDMAWTRENSGGQTHVVATKAPNAFGFYDMLGNVWEWMSGHGLDESIGCRHGGSFCDVAADCSVNKGYHNERSHRHESCGLRLAARVRPTAAGRAEDAAHR